MYADKITDSMKKAIDETKRRRSIQEKYNEEHGITPKTIIKPIRDNISAVVEEEVKSSTGDPDVDYTKLNKKERQKVIEKLRQQMKDAAKKLDFEDAAQLRDTILELEAQE